MKQICLIFNCFILILSSTSFSLTDPNEKHPWLGIHLLMTRGDTTEQLTDTVKDLAQLGVNTIVAEIDYGYEYQSHPNLRSPNASSKEQLKELLAACRKNGIRLIPEFQCLGHQSWERMTSPLLTQYPQFDETPGKYPNNKGIYCRSWCPLHPEINPIIFDLMDELIEVLQADAFHVGMDEVFLIAEDSCPRCRGRSKAEIFAKAVNDYHKHIVGKHKIEMLMWGDRLIDSNEINYDSWESSTNNTARAVDLIPKDIIICDWHYGTRDAYESIPMFTEKGFRVWPASWRKVEAAKALIDYSLRQNSPRIIGHLNTTWGAVPINKLADFEPLQYSIHAFE